MVSHQTLRRLVYFAAIADAGSIRGAAKRLRLSVPVLSEALSELEAELGVSLAMRTTRHFELTQAGMRTQIAAQSILDMATELTDLAATDRDLQGSLSVTVPVEIANFWLPNMIGRFQADHPWVHFDIDVTDYVVDLRPTKIEMAIRTDYVAPAQESRSAVNLPLVVVARNAVLVNEDGRVDMPLIDSKTDRELSATSREDGRMLPLRFAKTHRITNRSAGLQMARDGIGAALVMRGSVIADLSNGTLVELLPDYDFGSIDLKCHFRDRLPSLAVRSFAAMIGLDAPHLTARSGTK